MIKIEISIQDLKNEITQINTDINATRTMTDNQRRDALGILSEKVKTLLARLSGNAIDVVIK